MYELELCTYNGIGIYLEFKHSSLSHMKYLDGMTGKILVQNIMLLWTLFKYQNS